MPKLRPLEQEALGELRKHLERNPGEPVPNDLRSDLLLLLQSVDLDEVRVGSQASIEEAGW